MKVRTDLSYIQSMMRDSMEEILVSLPYQSKRFTRLFKKILNCSHESIGMCRREEFVKDSFRIFSHVKIELGARE